MADGEVLRVGGRCHKNKTGFDLASSFCGERRDAGCHYRSDLADHSTSAGSRDADRDFCGFHKRQAGAVQAILNAGHLPSALEITDQFTLKAARAYLGEDSLPEGDAHLIVEIDGRRKAIASELEELERSLGESRSLVD